MTIYRPELVSGDKVPMAITHPKHLVPGTGPLTVGGRAVTGAGGAVAEMGNLIGSDRVTRAGSFDNVMLRALDKVSAAHQFAGELQERAIIDPDSVDVDDITIAQAEAEMALSISRTILNRVVQGWKDLINMR